MRWLSEVSPDSPRAICEEQLEQEAMAGKLGSLCLAARECEEGVDCGAGAGEGKPRSCRNCTTQPCAKDRRCLRSGGCFDLQDQACGLWEQVDFKDGAAEEVACRSWRRVCAGCRARFKECEALPWHVSDEGRMNAIFYAVGAVVALPMLLFCCLFAIRKLQNRDDRRAILQMRHERKGLVATSGRIEPGDIPPSGALWSVFYEFDRKTTSAASCSGELFLDMSNDGEVTGRGTDGCGQYKVEGRMDDRGQIAWGEEYPDYHQVEVFGTLFRPHEPKSWRIEGRFLSSLGMDGKLKAECLHMVKNPPPRPQAGKFDDPNACPMRRRPSVLDQVGRALNFTFSRPQDRPWYYRNQKYQNKVGPAGRTTESGKGPALGTEEPKAVPGGRRRGSLFGASAKQIKAEENRVCQRRRSIEDLQKGLPTPWQAAKDPASGTPYYYNPETSETSWSRPEHGTIQAGMTLNPEPPRSPRPPAPEKNTDKAITVVT